ncbi:MAG: LysR family transcriptional regulator [Stappiaceae bacterium]
MIDHLRAMAVFATVAEVGSFRAAAQRLGSSASVISHHVTALERHLDVPLIYRTTRKLSLTTAGERLAIRARAMVEAAELGFGEISQQSNSLVGSLKITAPAILQYARFVTRVSTFMRHHPKVDIRLTFTDRRINIVEEGLDLAFRVGQLEDSSLISRKLAQGRLQVCASPRYLQNVGHPQNPKDLERLELIDLVAVSTKILFKSTTPPLREYEVRMRHRISVDSGFAARRMAEEDCGVVMLPDFFVQQAIAEQQLVEILCDQWHAPTYGIYAVWPPNTGSNNLRSAFLQFIADIARSDVDADLSATSGNAQ